MNKAVGRRVRRLRQEKDWNQLQLAKKAGVTPNTLRGLEKGNLNTRWPKIQKIAKALGTTAEALIHGDDEIKPTDPLLDKLTREDLLMARAYHDSTTVMRQRVAALLRDGEDERVSRLVVLLQNIGADVLPFVEDFFRQFEEPAVRREPTIATTKAVK